MAKPYMLPSFREDPAFYDDCVLNYIRELMWLEDEVTLAAARKPSLCDYDGIPPAEE